MSGEPVTEDLGSGQVPHHLPGWSFRGMVTTQGSHTWRELGTKGQAGLARTLANDQGSPTAGSPYTP